MAQQSYMPKTDDGIALMLASFDDNISSFLAKYNLLSADALRVKQARMAWRWMLDCLEFGRQWAESVTSKKKQMRDGPGGTAQAMPTGPILPAVPKIDLGTGLQDIKWEPDFFVYFASLVARIKGAVNYDKADGDLLGIEGAQIPPPDPATVPLLKVTIGTGGVPQLEVSKGVFDGFDFCFKIGDGPVQNGPFVSTRRYLHPITLPGPGQAALYSYQAQYRYKGQPFGQKSMWVPHSVHG